MTLDTPVPLDQSSVPMNSAEPHLSDLEALLDRLKAPMAAWEVQALFLGSLTSTSFGLGPHRLLDRIFGPDVALGGNLDEANANLKVLVGLWNYLNAERLDGRVHLSGMMLPDPPTVGELRELADRRHSEVTWFARGIDAGGDDPFEFGDEGQEILQRIAEAGAFAEAFRRMLKKETDHDPAELQKVATNLGKITKVMEDLMLRLSVISDRVRAKAAAEYETLAASGQKSDDGAAVQGPIRVGRNDPCPCGSGKKWKQCHGSPTTGTVQ